MGDSEMNDLSSDARRDAIEKSLKSYHAANSTRTEHITYRGAGKDLEVITLSPQVLLLNHENSRFSAQLVDHPKREKVLKDPTSQESQDILSSLLRSTEEYKALKDELKTFGQKNPGMVNRQGMLINGNTRLVALRDNGATGILVAVLPEDAGPGDFLDLEMSLQMQKFTHQDYTFTNRLLLMKRYLDRGHSPKELGARMGWQKNIEKKIAQHLRMLELVLEIRAKNQGNFPFEFFDSKEQVMKDLDDAYQTRANLGDLAGAEQLKWIRIIGMLSGATKDQVRVMDEEFFDDEVVRRLEGKTEVITLINSDNSPILIDDLDDLLGGRNSSKFRPEEFADKLINASVNQEGKISPDIDEAFQEVGRQIKVAAEDVINRQRLENLLEEPAELIAEARINISNIASDLGSIVQHKGFKAGKFEYEMKQLIKSVEDLTVKAKKYLKEN
jgi:hypothetical protein